MAIEIGIAVPFILFFLGFDGIATELAYLALILAIVSQISFSIFIIKIFYISLGKNRYQKDLYGD